MIHVDMVGISSGFYCTNPLNQGWWKKLGVLDIHEVLIIYILIKRLIWCVLNVDDSQGNELGKNGGKCCRVNNEGALSGNGER